MPAPCVLLSMYVTDGQTDRPMDRLSSECIDVKI